MRRTRRTRGQKEGQTGRPERGTRGCHGYRRIPASPRCHGDGGTLSRSPICSFRSLCLSLSLPLRFLYPLLAHAGRLARTHEIPSYSLAGANLLSGDDERLVSLARSLRPSFAEGIRCSTERGKSKEWRTHGEETTRGYVCACAIHLVLHDDVEDSMLLSSIHLSTASHLQPRDALG